MLARRGPAGALRDSGTRAVDAGAVVPETEPADPAAAIAGPEAEDAPAQTAPSPD